MMADLGDRLGAALDQRLGDAAARQRQPLGDCKSLIVRADLTGPSSSRFTSGRIGGMMGHDGPARPD